MAQAYHNVAEQNPPLYRPPEPGAPSSPPDAPVVEPPLQPPVTDVPDMPIPGPVQL